MATPNMGMTKPTVGGSTDTWGTTLNDSVIDIIDAHDHTSGKGLQIPSAGLNINADLSFGGNAATALKASRFSGQASLTAQTLGLGVKSSDNELYWVTSGGTEVKLTDGTSINTSLVGGITGDYTTTTADVEYSDALKAYRFLQNESPDHWAEIRCGDLALFQKAASITKAVTLKSPNALAASYNVIFPGALPGSTSIVQMDSSGNLDVSNSTSLPASAPSAKQLIELDASGAMSATQAIHGRDDAIISPAQLTGSVNNYNPTDLAKARTLRLTTDAAVTYNMTGLAGGSDGRVIVLRNVDPTVAHDIQLLHESGSSTAANRFHLPGLSNLTLTPGSSAILQYDSTDSRWYCIAKAL